MKSNILYALIVSNGLQVVAPFAISSSNTPKRKKVTNQGKSSGGFAKSDDSVPTAHTPDDSASTQNLLNFLLGWKSEGLGGAEDAGTEIGFDMNTGMRGVYATKSFKKNDILCKIPSDCALALSDPNVADDAMQTAAQGGQNLLQWYMANDQAKQMWSAYLDTLPTGDSNFDPTPDYYSDAEIEAMEFPLATKVAKERKLELSELSGTTGISLEELQFATWLVSSRSFPIKLSVDDPLAREINAREGALTTQIQKEIRVLLPYLDMINHLSANFNAELHLIDPEKDDAWFAIRAVRPIKKGKEITIPYGTTGIETSVGLLMNYGFVPDENKIDERLILKGGDDCIEKLDGWSTTLEEDEAALESGGDSLGNMKNVLRLRVKLKKAYDTK